MKKQLILTFLFTSVIKLAFAQDYKPISECTNHNKFLYSGSLEQLRYYTDTILPGGTILFDLSKANEYRELSELYPLLQVDERSSFEPILEVPSQFDETVKYVRYQQYHGGVKVEGGGYALQIPNGPVDPCIHAYMLSPYIASDIDVPTTPTILTTDVERILRIATGASESESILTSHPELVIAQNLLNDCRYHLTWKVSYRSAGNPIAYIDAENGTILKTIKGDMNLNAPMVNYCQTPNPAPSVVACVQNLNDMNDGTVTKLMTPDGSVIGYDFKTLTDCDRSIADFIPSLIPQTSTNEWTPGTADPGVYQGFYVTSTVKPLFAGIGINFSKINVGVGCGEFNASSLSQSTTSNAYLVLGEAYPNTFALFDVVAHELGHTFLHKFLDSDGFAAGNSTLHEGIADMLGTYIESVVQGGNIDWIIGDDLPAIAQAIGRDLKKPQYNCFPDADKNANLDEHTRSQPLGHWFYLLSQGGSNNGVLIPALGIKKALQIVLESLNGIDPKGDYPQLREKTIVAVEKHFGPCSDEAIAVRNAWEAICVGKAEVPENCYTIRGISTVCEEGEDLSLCTIGGVAGGSFQWTFPRDWRVIGNPVNNGGATSTLISDCLHVIDFPKYNSYPQYFTVQVTSINPAMPTSAIPGGSYYNYTQKKVVTLVDCYGDDSPCGAAIAKNSSSSNSNTSIHFSNNTVVANDNLTFTKIQVFDPIGRLLCEGKDAEDISKRTFAYTGLLFYAYYDENNNLLTTKKIIKIQH